MRRIGADERQARLGIRHLLAKSTQPTTAVEVARNMVALHATDPASVFLSVRARTPAIDIDALERCLYEERSLFRLLGMRRTMFVVPTERVPVIQAACSNALAQAQRSTYAGLLSKAGVGDETWLKQVEESTHIALRRRGRAAASELSADEPRLRTQITLAEGKPYGSRQTITSWVLLLLAAEGRIGRGRPRNGSWLSSQWIWEPIDAWFPDGMAVIPTDIARAELVRSWLATFGPGTVADLRWWTGWNAGPVKTALASLGAAEADLDGEPGYLLPDDLEPVAAPEPWVALLPALDPTPMGWSRREFYLGPHAPALFDRGGTVAPTVWSNGRIIGGWAQRADGEIVWRLLEEVSTDTQAAVAAEAARLADWLGPVRLAPRTRLRPPLERELVS